MTRLVVVASLAGSMCHAQPGEPLRGHTVTHERGRQQAYLIGAVSHRAAVRGLVIEVPIGRDELAGALEASLRAAFGGMLSCDDHEDINDLLQLAADLPVGGIVCVSVKSWSGYRSTPESLAAAATLAPVTVSMLQGLLAS